MNSKSPLKSKTLWGVLIMLVSYYLGKEGIDISQDTQNTLVSNIMTIVSTVGQIAGTVLAVYGRYKANTSLKIK